MKKLQNKKGFTLVEMIVVLAIIAILIALLAPNVARLIKNAQRTSDSAKAKTIMNGAMTYGTEAVSDGQSVTTTGTVSIGTAGEFGVELTPGNSASFVNVYYNGITGAPALMGGSGDDYLPSNALTNNDRAFIYISPEGAVMGVVYYNTSGGISTIKAVAGVCPSAVSASFPAGVTFSTGDLRQTHTIDPTDGSIS